MSAIRHTWAFDDMFSTYALQGIAHARKGQYTREELKPLAKVNVTSLKEFDFFTYAKADGRKAVFADPVDYWLDYNDSILTLHFTLPLKTPVAARTMVSRPRSLRSDHLRRFRIRQGQTGHPGRCAAAMPALRRSSPPADGGRAVAAEPARRQPARSLRHLRRDVRQQDPGAVSMTFRHEEDNHPNEPRHPPDRRPARRIRTRRRLKGRGNQPVPAPRRPAQRVLKVPPAITEGSWTLRCAEWRTSH